MAWFAEDMLLTVVYNGTMTTKGREHFPHRIVGRDLCIIRCRRLRW